MKANKNKAKASEKKVLGRPKKAEQRTKLVTLRVTEHEREHCLRAANASGRSLSNHLRYLLGLPEDAYRSDPGTS